MSKTPVSELNARMSLDVSPLEQAVPKAEALLNRIDQAKQEAMRPQSDSGEATAVLTRAERVAAQRMARVKRQQEEIIEQSTFELANPFQRQVLAVQQLNKLLANRNQFQAGSLEYETAQLAVLRQQAQVDRIRASLTAGMDLSRLGNTAADSQKGFARAGLAMQQFGYQAQDFAVQVTSGTNALVALSQQGSQMLGFLGGWQFALAGAALSAGILAYRVATMGGEVEKSTKAIKTQKEALEELIRARRSLDISRDASKERSYVEADLRAAEAALKRAKAESDAADAELRAARKRAEASTQFAAASRATPLALVGFARFVASRFDLSSATKEVKTLSAAFDSSKASAVSATEAVEGLYGKAEKEATQNRRSAFEDYGKAINDAEKELIQLGRRNESVFDAIRREQEALDDIAVFDKDSEVAYAQQEVVVAKLIAQAEDMAKKYREQLDPINEQKRTIEEILRLKESGLLTDREAALLQTRIADERERQLKLPDVMRQQTGSSYAGMRNTDGTAQQQLNIMQQQLAALRTLVFQGAN